MVHRFGTEEFTDARSQDRESVGAAGVGGWTGPFELQHPTLPLRVDDLTEIDRSAVSELASPMTELMAAVTHGKRFHLRQKLPAREGIEEPLGLHLGVAKPDQIRHFRGMGKKLWCGGFDGQGG